MMIVAVVLGVLFCIAGIIYFVKTANNLPSFFPGHDVNLVAKHTKHGIAAVILGLLCFVYAWFQTGPKAASTSQQ